MSIRKLYVAGWLAAHNWPKPPAPPVEDVGPFWLSGFHDGERVVEAGDADPDIRTARIAYWRHARTRPCQSAPGIDCDHCAALMPRVYLPPGDDRDAALEAIEMENNR